MSFKIVYNKIIYMGFNIFSYEIILKMRNNVFFCNEIINYFKFIFQFFKNLIISYSFRFPYQIKMIFVQTESVFSIHNRSRKDSYSIEVSQINNICSTKRLNSFLVIIFDRLFSFLM